MRLRAIEIRNWACIETLTLSDLADGIIVLSGPNRTGKSSVVQAIRSTLFDHFHDSQESSLLAAVPWRTRAAPHVAIEFEHAGKRFRISKTFAKTKDGQTTLEQHGAAGWTVLEKTKEAARRVRELIGVDSSEAGVFQMLWLGQRDFQLPRPRDVDPTLAKAVESVLGTLITGQDIDFKERVDRACERWFTVKTMQDRKGSPVTRLANDLAQAQAHKVEIDRLWTEAEAALRQYDEALARQPDLRRSLNEVESELASVARQCEAIRHRKAQFELAVKHRAQSERLVQQAEARLREFDEATHLAKTAAKALADLRLEQRSIEDKRADAERSAAEARAAADLAEVRLGEHQQGRAALDARQGLIANRLEQESLLDRISQAEQFDLERQALENKLVGPVVLSEKEVRALREKQEKAASLRHRLQAAEIHVTIRPRHELAIEVSRDGAVAEQVKLDAAQDVAWLIRQRAEIRLGDVATIRIGRGEEDRDVETLARELAELERSLRESWSAANCDPLDPNALDHLVARRLSHEQAIQQLDQVRAAFAKAAPNGLPALRGQLQQKRDEQEAILARCPELRAWTPEPAELGRMRFEFDEREDALKAAVHNARQLGFQASEALQQIKDASQAIRTRIAALSVQLDNQQVRLRGQDRAALLGEIDQGKARCEEAQRKVAESTLSEAEQALEARLESVRAAHANRAGRMRDNEDLLLRLRTQLAGAEGLHQRRNLAEQAVNDLSRELERETMYAQAHKHLKELFEKVRQEQVRRTVGPINDRVMQWATQLGVTEYAGLSFGDQLLPSGLLSNHASDGAPVEMERESFGTQEQLSILIRLAVGGLLAKDEPTVAILDDPLAHADPVKHRRMLEILVRAVKGEPLGPHPTGPLQLLILTCHADRFDYLEGAQQIDLAALIRRGG